MKDDGRQGDPAPTASDARNLALRLLKVGAAMLRRGSNSTHSQSAALVVSLCEHVVRNVIRVVL